MKTTLSALAGVLALSAATGAAAADDMAKMKGMPMASAAKVGHGAGVIKAVDAKAGTVTIEHGPIAEAGWPAMTMTFKAAPKITGKAKVGEKVAFDVKLQGTGGEVTAIKKQ